MTGTASSLSATAEHVRSDSPCSPRRQVASRRRRRLLVGAVVVVIAATLAIGLTNPFGKECADKGLRGGQC